MCSHTLTAKHASTADSVEAGSQSMQPMEPFPTLVSQPSTGYGPAMPHCSGIARSSSQLAPHPMSPRLDSLMKTCCHVHAWLAGLYCHARKMVGKNDQPTQTHSQPTSTLTETKWSCNDWEDKTMQCCTCRQGRVDGKLAPILGLQSHAHRWAHRHRKCYFKTYLLHAGVLWASLLPA